MPRASVVSSLTQAWKSALRPPERLGVCDWAERNLRLSPKVSNFPGPFKSERTPYLRGIMDAFRDPSIEVLYLCFGAQTAKTTGMLCCLLYTLAEDPGPVLWAMPSESLARSFSQTRLQPLVEDTPALASEKPANADLFKTLEMQFRRSTLNLVGANSPSNLSSRSIRYLFADEVDKFPVETTREGSALNLCVRRTASYWNRKIVVSSTPSLREGQIWIGLLAGDWREYWVPCPACGALQVLTFHGIRKPEGATDLEVIRTKSWYECAFCEAHIENHHKPAMLLAGEWRPKQERVPEYDWTPPAPGASVASFHLPAWYSPWSRWGDVLARFIEAKPYPEVLREIVNSDLAEPWEERGETKREEDILAHRSEYGPAQIPAGAQILAVTQTVDVQQDHLLYTVRAWGPMEETWLLSYGVLPDFDALAETLVREYGPETNLHGVRLCLVDSGFRTDEVYTFCRSHRNCIPVKGADQIRQPLLWSSVDRLPRSGAAIPGGLKLVLVQAAHWREALFNRLSIRRGDPGYWHLHAEVGEDYARQICSEVLIERKDARGRVTRSWKQVRPDNHYLDCEVYQLVAGAGILGLRYARTDNRPKVSDPDRPIPWFGNTQNWFSRKGR